MLDALLKGFIVCKGVGVVLKGDEAFKYGVDPLKGCKYSLKRVRFCLKVLDSLLRGLIICEGFRVFSKGVRA